MSKLSTKKIRKLKNEKKIAMLTCYDFQTAQAINESDIDIILVGDSLGNVILGYNTTVPVKPHEMITFGKAVRRGAPNKFIVIDLPFGSYGGFEQAIENAVFIFQESGADAIKLEGADELDLKIIKRLTQIGIPVIGHIGLKPQKVKEEGGYFIKGKAEREAQDLLDEALSLEQAGVFSITLECIISEVAQEITSRLKIPTIGIGSGPDTDGQVLVLNDLLGDTKKTPPSFCTPISNFYKQRVDCINSYLRSVRG